MIFKKFLLLIGIATCFQSIHSQIFTEEFESGSGAYITTASECNSGSDYFALTNDSGIPAVFTGSTGNYFAAQDIDGCASVTESISWSGINIAGCTGLSFSIDLAEDDDGSNEDWDIGDYLHVYYSIDGGAEQDLIWVENDGSNFNSAPFIDTDFNGDGDGTEITDVFTTFTNSIAGTGNTIDIRIEINLNSGDEDIAFDNLELTGSCGPPPANTITTGIVSPLSYTVDCSNGQTGTVNFTSTDVYNGGNTFTAQLSDASGSFASATSIGTLTLSGTDPSGTINITIPSGTASGTGYRIRVVSSDPAVNGTDNGTDITITLTGGPCVLQPPHATSMIINSCNTTCGEGNNEVIFGNTGDYSVDMSSTNLDVSYGNSSPPTDSYTDVITTNNATTSDLNTGCPGLFIDATGTTVPPNSSFMIVNDAFCPGDGLDFSNFCGQGPIYVIYSTDGTWSTGNPSGNFVNNSSCSGGVRYIQTTITSTDGTTHVIDYDFDCSLNSGADGDYAKWDFNGGLAIEQGNNGCTLDPVVLPVDLVDLQLKSVQNEQVEIKWMTSSELNNNSFTLYHSIDGYSFKPFETIQGAGNSDVRQYYRSIHRGPTDGMNYYLLRSTDFDGTTYFKNLKAINVEKSIVYFDYSTDLLHLPTSANYQILSIEGRVIKEV